MEDMIYKWVLSGSILLILAYLIYIEIIQSVGIPFKEYLMTTSNFFDMYTYIVSAWLIIVNLTGIAWPALFE